jgi:alpha-L-arabinofuranosidase
MNTIKVEIFPDKELHIINPNLYGHFIEHLGKCIYNGIWVGEDSKIENINGIRKDTVDTLKKLDLPVLRWPGGCFADNYHWTDGIGPREKRPKRLNIWWNQPESNEFGTDEFMRFCQLIGTEPYICLNVGSGTVEEARSWVEYCNSNQKTTLVDMRRKNGHDQPYNVKYWGIGNENWVCGGSMRPEYYADLYRQYATYIRKTAGENAKLIACGSYPDFPEWDDIYLSSMKRAYNLVDAIALHIYAWDGGSDINFDDKDYCNLLDDIKIVKNHLTRALNLANAYSTNDHKIQVVFDEWGTWYKEATVESGLYQQNTMRDALYAAASFHLFHDLGENLIMTNMAQTVNVLQSLILTKGEKLLRTPTYYVYEMFKEHRSGSILPKNILFMDNADEKLKKSVSISITKKIDEIFISIVNLDLKDNFNLDLDLNTRSDYKIKNISIINSSDVHDHNTFENPDKVFIKNIPSVVEKGNINIPAHSITGIKMEKIK